MAHLPSFLLLIYHIKAQQNVPWNVGWYNPDYSPIQEKEKVVGLSKELIVDIKNKVHMTDEIRSKMEQDHTFLFHVGIALGSIRELYKAQLEMFRQMRDKFTSRNRINTPEYRRSCVSVHFVIAMEEIYGKEVQIEYKILALLKVPSHQYEEQGVNGPSAALDIDSGHGRIFGKPKSANDGRDAERPHEKTKPKSLRSGHTVEEVTKGMSEHELKKNLRAQYYQRHKNA